MGNKKSIFTCIRHGMTYLSEKKDEETASRLKTLKLLEDFVYSGSYTKYRNKDVFLSMESENDKVIAKKLGVSIAGVRQARKRLSEEVFTLLGDDVVDKILHGDIRACQLITDNILLLKSTANEEFIISEIEERLSNAYIGEGTAEFNLRDCRDEMAFLSLFTLNRFSYLVNNLDSEKLNYIMRLINGDVRNANDKFVALKYMTSDKSFEDAVHSLQDYATSSKG